MGNTRQQKSSQALNSGPQSCSQNWEQIGDFGNILCNTFHIPQQIITYKK